MEQNNKIALFQEKAIRRIWHNEAWYFSIIDVIEALTGSPQPSRYWHELREKLLQESQNAQLFANTEKLKMKSLDGVKHKQNALFIYPYFPISYPKFDRPNGFYVVPKTR